MSDSERDTHSLVYSFIPTLILHNPLIIQLTHPLRPNDSVIHPSSTPSFLYHSLPPLLLPHPTTAPSPLHYPLYPPHPGAPPPGYLPGASQFAITPGHQSSPVLHCHGTADPVVIADWATKTRDHVTSKGGLRYDLATYPGVGHTVTPPILARAQDFLVEILADAPHLAVKPKAPAEMSVKELKEAVRRAGLGAKAVGFYEKEEFVKLLEAHYAGTGSG